MTFNGKTCCDTISLKGPCTFLPRVCMCVCELINVAAAGVCEGQANAVGAPWLILHLVSFIYRYTQPPPPRASRAPSPMASIPRGGGDVELCYPLPHPHTPGRTRDELCAVCKINVRLISPCLFRGSRFGGCLIMFIRRVNLQ